MNTDAIPAAPIGLRHAALTERIIGVFYAVYSELGCGFLETVYHRALYFALVEAGLKVATEVAVPVWFRGKDVGNFRADLIVEDEILLELKTAEHIDRAHEAQLLNYLRATEIGRRPEFRRIVLDNDKKKIRVHPW